MRVASNLSIELDSQGPYRAGDRLRGRLSVAALEQLEVTHALVHLAWTTFGRGEVTLGEGSFFRIPGFELAPEEVRDFGFELVVPEGPISFGGELFGVRWEVRAELIIDWAKNPKCACEFTVVAPARMPLGSGYRGALKPTHAPGSELVVSKVPSNPLRWLLLLVPPIGGYQLLLRTDFFPPVVALVVMLTVGAFVFSWRALRNRIAQSAIGPVIITVSPAEALRGQTVQVSLQLRPPRRLELRVAKVNLVCTESVWVRKGKSSAVESAPNLTLPLLLEISLQLEAGESRELIGSAVLPEGCLPTFGKPGRSNVTWEVVVELERSGVDFREQVPLRVSA